MNGLIILGIMLLGTFLMVAEIIFVPGTTIVGVLGFIFSGYCIYLGYEYYGPATGSLILIGAFLLNVTSLIVAFKSRSWERFSLKNTMKGHINDDKKISIKEGDRGVTLSALKPIGNALFGEDEIVVQSDGGFVVENIEIEVKKIEHSKIIVQPV